MRLQLIVTLAGLCVGASLPAQSVDSASVTRRGTPADIQSLGRVASAVMDVLWFGGGQAVSEVSGCQVALSTARTDGPVRHSISQRFDAGWIGGMSEKREHDTPAMTTSIKALSRGGTRFVVRESQRFEGKVRTGEKTDTLDALDISVALGDPANRLRAIGLALMAFADACRPIDK